MLKFITGNKNKFLEVKSILAPVQVKQISIDLEELQEIDQQKIIIHKLRQAFKVEKSEFIVEDVSVYLGCLDNRLPGPLIKWFNHTIGNKGLVDLTKKMKNTEAVIKVVVGYAKSVNNIAFFEGKMLGNIVSPKGNSGFAFDPIFKPKGSSKTLAELKSEDYIQFSPRAIAINKLKRVLV